MWKAEIPDRIDGMPEEPELDTDSLNETIREPPSGTLLRNIALTTALLAALGAVAALRAGDTVNEALVLKTEAGRLQAEASDQWAYYQAKGIKASVQDASRASWLAAGKNAAHELRADDSALRHRTKSHRRGSSREGNESATKIEGGR